MPKITDMSKSELILVIENQDKTIERLKEMVLDEWSDTAGLNWDRKKAKDQIEKELEGGE